MRRCTMDMYLCTFIIFVGAFFGSSTVSAKLCFPQHFAFGVATAAYQIEGAWNVSDKGESIWDHYVHNHPERIFDQTNADVADDSYHLFKEDVRLLKELGVQFYRFSVSWPRVLPSGFSNVVSKEGVRYYKTLIRELRENGIEPVVTMYHWDLPQSLQELGGWTNPIMAEYFTDYARVLFTTFGHDIKNWITFNEPLSFCQEGYGGLSAPGGNASGFEDYLCAHNVLRAHGMAYRMYQQEFKRRQKGIIMITLDMAWMEPSTTSQQDLEAAETARQFNFGWFAHPIFSQEGDYPPIMRKRVDDCSRKQGYTRSRLPTFTEEEVDMIRGSYDILGLNHYTTYMIKYKPDDVEKEASFQNDVGVGVYQKQEWPKSSSSWLKVVPWGFRKILNWLRETYGNIPILVTENGISLPAGLNDARRIAYIDAYLRNLHTAITKDGCNVVGYTYWSLLDNFEWMRGFSERFGLYETNFTSVEKTRTARASATYFSDVAKTRCLPHTEHRYKYIVDNRH